MRRRERLSGLMVLPVVISFASARCRLLWLIPVAVIMMFVLVAALPFCRKHENLWVFVLTAVSSLPVNWLLLTKFDSWTDYLYSGGGAISEKMVIIEYMMILMGVEEIILGLITRLIWRKQYKLYIPVDE